MAYDIPESIGLQPSAVIELTHLLKILCLALMSEIRFEPVDKEVMIAVAEAEDLAQQV